MQRLAQQLQAAHVTESPLLAPAAAPAAVEVFREDFSSFDPGALGWPAGAAVVGAAPDAEPAALDFAGRRASQSLLILPAEPSTVYRVSRRLWTADAGIDLQVLESPASLPPDQDHRAWLAGLVTERFVQPRAVGALHRFPARPEAGAWVTDQLTLRTSRETHALILRLDDPMHTHAPTAASVWLDDVVVERLEGAALALGAAPLGGSPLAYRGAPLVSHDSGGAHHSQDLLYLPTPTALTMPVTVPAGGSLFFTYGPGPQSAPGEQARLRVRQGARTVFDETVAFEDETSARWRRARIPLAAGAHDLTIESSRPGGGLSHLLLGSPLLLAPRPADGPPNVVLIAIDTLRADRLSCYGAPRRNSPHLDALAARGALFEQAIAPSNWTASSFATLLTGLHPGEHGVIYRTRAVPEAAETLAERFAAAGWLTLGASYKAYLHGMGFEQGFDRWFSAPYPGARGADVLSVAQQWLAEHHQQPFFLFFHLNEPHQPFNQPPWFRGRRADVDALDRLGIRLPFGANQEDAWCDACGPRDGPTPEAVQLVRDLYDEEVLYADHIVGALLDTLGAYGLTDDTIVAVVSDHGELLWEGDRLGHGGRELTDPLTHVPLIVVPHQDAAPALALAPRRVSAQVRALDLGPTLLDLAGLPATGFGDARSLRPLLAADGPDTPAVSENIREQVLSVRLPGWKLVLDHHDDKPSALFYDLTADPAERVPRRPPPPIKGALMDAAVDHILAHREGPFVVVTGSPDQERAVRLRADDQTTLAPLLGIRPTGDGGWIAAGRGRWLGVAQVIGDGTVAADAPLPRASAPPDGPGAVIVPGTAAGLSAAPPRAESAERDAALRAMGYIE